MRITDDFIVYRLNGAWAVRNQCGLDNRRWYFFQLSDAEDWATYLNRWETA